MNNLLSRIGLFDLLKSCGFMENDYNTSVEIEKDLFDKEFNLTKLESWYRILSCEMKPKFLIIDIDETLGRSFFRPTDLYHSYDQSTPITIKGNTKSLSEIYWIPRPNVIKFLKLIIPKLSGWAVWTLGTSEYAENIVKGFLHSNDLYPNFILCKNHATEYSKHISYFIKGLKEDHELYVSSKTENCDLDTWKQHTSLTNTWLLDNDPIHFSENTQGILISDFDLSIKDTLYSDLINFFELTE